MIIIKIPVICILHLHFAQLSYSPGYQPRATKSSDTQDECQLRTQEIDEHDEGPSAGDEECDLLGCGLCVGFALVGGATYVQN